MGQPFLKMLQRKRAGKKHKEALSAAPRFSYGSDRLSGAMGSGFGGRSIYHDERDKNGFVVPRG